MKTLVIGASVNPERYAYLAVQRLLRHGHEVVALGLRPGKINDVTIDTGRPAYSDLHTVTLYINPSRQKDFYDYILSLKPKRVIFNPGTENSEFELLLRKEGIFAIEACTLVLLSTGSFNVLTA